MSEYLNTIIYKIVCKDILITECYVGHTTDLINRTYNHIYNCFHINGGKYHYKLYQFVRTNGGWENWEIIEIKKYPCNNLQEAKKEERYWIETLQSKLNQIIPLRTDSEHYYENKEKHLIKCKNYYEEHKEEILDYHKNYYKDNKEKILDYAKNYRKEHKEHYNEYLKNYREENKDKIKENRKTYYIEHKEELTRKSKEKRLRKKELKLMGLEDIRVI